MYHSNEMSGEKNLFNPYSSYGYVNPLGDIKEFTYESGLPCDPLTKQPIGNPSPPAAGLRRSAASTRGGGGAQRFGQPSKASVTGYYDYSDNRFVLPDGRRVKVVVNRDKMARG